MSVKPQLLLGPVVMFICWLLQVVSLATPEWTKDQSDVLPIKFKFGPFRSCAEDDCRSYTEEDIDSNLKAVRALGVVSVLLSSLAFTLAAIFIVFVFLDKVYSLYLPGTSMAACLLASILSLAGIITWAVEFHTASQYYGYSFVLHLVSGQLLSAGGSHFFLASRSQLRHQPKRPPRYLATPTDYTRLAKSADKGHVITTFGPDSYTPRGHVFTTSEAARPVDRPLVSSYPQSGRAGGLQSISF